MDARRNSAPVDVPQRLAGVHQGAVLVFSQVLALMGMLLVAPVLPSMQQYFQTAAYSTLLVPLVMTAPSLCIALLSSPMGWLADRLGLRPVLAGTLVMYAVCGTAPIYLDNLYWIVTSRLGVGVAEAGILTCGTAFMGAYFEGSARKKWLSYQAAAATAAASILLVATGKFAGIYWRAPFAAYSLSLIMLWGTMRYLWEPLARAGDAAPTRVPLGARYVIRTAALAMVGGIMFGVAPVELGFLLTANGNANAETISLILASGTVALLFGTLAAKQMARMQTSAVLAAALVVMACGLLIMVSNSRIPAVSVGVIVQQFAGGVMLPTAIGYTLSGLSQDQQGRAAGLWWSVYSVAQFLTPLAVNLAQGATGSLARGIAVLAMSGILITLLLAFRTVTTDLKRDLSGVS